nr:unnamed protein product [Digitaria exilis]
MGIRGTAASTDLGGAARELTIVRDILLIFLHFPFTEKQPLNSAKFLAKTNAQPRHQGHLSTQPRNPTNRRRRSVPTYVSNQPRPSDRDSTARVASSPLEGSCRRHPFNPALLLPQRRTDRPRRRKRTRDRTKEASIDRRDGMSSPAEDECLALTDGSREVVYESGCGIDAPLSRKKLLLVYFRYYKSLPPISKAYGTLCFFTTVLVKLQILNPQFLALYYPFVFKKFEIWRLFTTFFFLGPFSINFGIRLLMIARYGVQLEKGVFENRTADFLWMMIFGGISLLVVSAIPLFESYFLGIPMVSMLLYVWSREYPNSQINMYGLVQLRSFYLPWAMLALDVIFGSPLLPGLLGIMVGHLYYFLSVLHPLATGKNYLKTPKWVYPFTQFWPNNSQHSIVARFRIGVQANTPVRPPANTGTGAFRGRSYRLNQ